MARGNGALSSQACRRSCPSGISLGPWYLPRVPHQWQCAPLPPPLPQHPSARCPPLLPQGGVQRATVAQRQPGRWRRQLAPGSWGRMWCMLVPAPRLTAPTSAAGSTGVCASARRAPPPPQALPALPPQLLLLAPRCLLGCGRPPTVWSGQCRERWCGLLGPQALAPPCQLTCAIARRLRLPWPNIVGGPLESCLPLRSALNQRPTASHLDGTPNWQELLATNATATAAATVTAKTMDAAASWSGPPPPPAPIHCTCIVSVPVFFYLCVSTSLSS